MLEQNKEQKHLCALSVLAKKGAFVKMVRNAHLMHLTHRKQHSNLKFHIHASTHRRQRVPP